MLRRFTTTLRIIPQFQKLLKMQPFCYVNTNKFYFSQKGSNKHIQKQQINEQQLKQQGRQFYNNYVQKITELKSSGDFEKLITSIKQPIILDFYADWCGPCKKLTPKLQAKVNSLQGVKMIKVNIDKCPQIAKALQVKSVPTVYLIYQGQAVDKIQGNVADPQFNKFFESISKISGESPQHKQAIEQLQKAKQLIAKKQFEQAIKILQNFKQKKIGIDLIAIKELLLSQSYLSIGKVSKFKDSISRAGTHENFLKQVPQLLKFYQIMQEQSLKFERQSKESPQIQQLKQKIQKAASQNQRLQAKFQLMNFYKEKDLSQNALDTAMDIIKENKNWDEKKTNKAVLAIFKQLGNNSPLVQKYRKILQRLLS